MPGSYPTTADSTTKKGFFSDFECAVSQLHPTSESPPSQWRTLDFLLALGLQADLVMGREFGSHGLPYILQNEAPTLQPEMQAHNCVTTA